MEEIYEGTCFGGPLNGQVAVSRKPKGFLLVDKQNNMCWIYEWINDDLGFTVRNSEPMEVMTKGPKNRYRAADEDNYDVLAV